MREPLYAQIARELAQGIASGKFPEGSLLSSEFDLCNQYQASRQTVRAALRELMDLGLVSRRKGVGTRVEARTKAQGYDHSLGSLDDLVQLAMTNPRVVKRTNEVVADRELAKAIGCAPGSRWLHIASIRQDSDKSAPPVCWTDTYVNTAYSDLSQLVRQDPTPLISELIEKHYGRRSAEVHQTISAVTISPLLAEELQVEPGSPALRIVRRYIDRVGETIETTISVHPAERYTFSMVLKRSSIGQDANLTT
ncbi:transcriptional regulator, GntR family [Rhodoferax ferrireducens T118]|uniref:Transcriptional regulator, GntR family n=1 Tax=Albidiferax ferrireducens (strain ATCC BAA-621 / DSM 15236 / T118) TaxID=338969 RepID=Q223J2_ALBFT|nr:GntR family transcriptional regulator [Rhodoferax ferrireducens]ABD67775.1 transcriptional regulator, GntR family [Rhodoferax ferrireducens T118]